MPKNECILCGGGFGGYTAPEARCECKEPLTASQKEKLERQKDVKHQLLLAESRYLLASGWRTHEQFESAAKGFLWNPPHEAGPVSQKVAVATQKEWDENPETKRNVILSFDCIRLVKAIDVAKTHGLHSKPMVARLEKEHQDLVDQMNENLSQRSSG